MVVLDFSVCTLGLDKAAFIIGSPRPVAINIQFQCTLRKKEINAPTVQTNCTSVTKFTDSEDNKSINGYMLPSDLKTAPLLLAVK